MCTVSLVRRRPVNGVDHQDVAWTARRVELEAELFLQRREDRRRGCDWLIACVRRPGAAPASGLRREREIEVEQTREAGPIQYGSTHQRRQSRCKLRES